MQTLLFIAKSGAFLIGSVALIRIYLNKSRVKCESKRRLDGQTVVISGANSGIGKETARSLLQRGAKVILACRNEASARQAIDEFRKENASASAIFKHLDLNSFQSVQRFADDVIKTEPRIDVLINNAAVFKCPYLITEDGYETHYAVNHLSQALLTSLLLPKLSETGTDSSPSRIVFVSSILYKYGVIRDVDFEPNAITPENYDKKHAYANSKLASLLFARELGNQVHERKMPVKVFLASPGMVYTNLGRYMNFIVRALMAPLAFCFLRTAKQGSQTILHCVLEAVENGSFFRNCQKTKFDGIANDRNVIMKTFDRTLAATKSRGLFSTTKVVN